MEKLIYLLSRPDDVTVLRQELLKQTVPALQAAGAVDITLTIADMDDAVITEAPERIARDWSSLGASVALWLDCVDERVALPLISQDLAQNQ